MRAGDRVRAIAGKHEGKIGEVIGPFIAEGLGTVGDGDLEGRWFVEFKDSVVVMLARIGDFVLGMGELVLQLEEILICLEIRILFNYNHQTRKAGCQITLSFLEFSHRLRVTQLVRRYIY